MALYIKFKEFDSVRVGNRIISSIYNGNKLIWSAAMRLWKGRQIWKGNEIWKK